MDSIAADTSFYSCFFCHLKDETLLFNFISRYKFYVGDNILNEIPTKLTETDVFKTEVKIYNYNYSILLLPFFERDIKHMDDGEYEAIGLAWFLKNNDELKYLIIDDRRPRKFVENHFSFLNEHLRGTLGFIQDCCCLDEHIDSDTAINTLSDIKTLVEEGIDDLRPCSMDEKNYVKLIDPIIEELRSWDDGGL